MSKVDRFLEALTKDVDVSKVSFMGFNISTLLGMLRGMVSDDELEKMIDSAVRTWMSL